MKIKVRLFWKVYLTMMIVLFLPVMIIALEDIFRNREDRVAGMARFLEWSASKIADESEQVSDRSMVPWIAEVSEQSGLGIYIRRGGKSFYSPGSEHLASFEPDTQRPVPRRPIVSSAGSRSGNTEAIVETYPFGPRPNDSRGPRIPPSLWATLLLCLAFSFVLVRNFITPLLELGRTTGKMQRGDLSVRVSSNVTERVDEFADLGRSFNKMAERVESLLSSQKRLLSDISHEIRSPLQCVQVATALLRKERGSGEKYIDRIELEISRIDNMVEELLTLTRVNEMQMTDREPVDLNELFDPIAEELSFAHGIKMDKIHVNTRNLSVTGDATLLSRALGNIASNAARYTAPDSGIEIDAHPERDGVAIVVRDHGQGVSDEELDKIFLPYYRTDKARARSQGGLGLGLAISKRIIESHGGVISAKNAAGGGLIVTIYLPSPIQPVSL